MLGGLGALYWGGSWRRPLVRRLEIKPAGLPPALDGLRIGHLTDFHRSPLIPERVLALGALKMQQEQPDLIVLTGDFVSVAARYAVSCARALACLRAPLGVYAVMGNHDHWVNVAAVTRALAAVGIRTLFNEAVPLETGGEKWWLLGVDDTIAGDPDLERALKVASDSAWRLLLVHEPDFAPEAAAYDIPLQLSGHTHGGQLDLPLLGRAVLPEQGVLYPAGLSQVGHSDTQVYTNVGLGCVTAPLRFRCAPELAVITLRS